MDVHVWKMGREIKCVLLKDVMVCDSIILCELNISCVQ